MCKAGGEAVHLGECVHCGIPVYSAKAYRSSSMTMPTNRHAADRLHDVRVAIKELEAEEVQLREVLLANPCDRRGAEYQAVVAIRRRQRVDLEALAAEVGEEVMTRCTTTKPVVNVVLTEIEPGEE
jgi:hypothetical protein